MNDEMTKQIESTAKCAAKWWADKLRRGLPLLYNGDRSETALLIMGLASMAQEALAKKNPITAQDIDRFEAELERLLLDGDEFDHRFTTIRVGGAREETTRHHVLRGLRYEAARGKSLCEPGCMGMFVGVDYHPDWWLARAALAAGISVDMRFQFKTDMRIRFADIEVKEGYGAPWRALDASEEVKP